MRLSRVRPRKPRFRRNDNPSGGEQPMRLAPQPFGRCARQGQLAWRLCEKLNRGKAFEH